MKAIVVYESIFGNTKQVAEAVTEALRESCEAWTVDVTEAEYGIPDDIDLLVAGGPTHMLGMSRGISRRVARKAMEEMEGGDATKLEYGVREWLRKLPKVAGKKAAAFDTRAPKTGRMPTGGAANGIASGLKGKGYTLIGEPTGFFVEANFDGPLVEGELERAAAWAKDLIKTKVAAASR